MIMSSYILIAKISRRVHLPFIERLFPPREIIGALPRSPLNKNTIFISLIVYYTKRRYHKLRIPDRFSRILIAGRG